MKEINQQVFEGERAQFKAHDTHFQNCTFQNGESPLKHSRHVTVDHNIFKWKYPLWYSDDVDVTNSTLKAGAHAGIWYTKNLRMDNVMIEDTKTFRHISDSQLSNITISNAAETLWWCQDVKLDHITATGDYFGKNCENITVDHLHLSGNYAFDGSKNIEVHNSVFETHDAFWNCDNVTVYDSTLIGEYLAWNTKHIRFVNCWIESEQGLCYVDDLVMENCSLVNTNLAFEYCSKVQADIVTKIDSVKNPISGVISAPEIGEIIQDDPELDKTACQINVRRQTA